MKLLSSGGPSCTQHSLGISRYCPDSCLATCLSSGKLSAKSSFLQACPCRPSQLRFNWSHTEVTFRDAAPPPLYLLRQERTGMGRQTLSGWAEASPAALGAGDAVEWQPEEERRGTAEAPGGTRETRSPSAVWSQVAPRGRHRVGANGRMGRNPNVFSKPGYQEISLKEKLRNRSKDTPIRTCTLRHGILL